MIELPFVNYILGLLIITNSAFIYSSINLMRKNEKLEDWLVDLENDLQQVENEITEADSSGGFAADDEVGTIWRTIKTSLRKLEKYTKGDNIDAS